MIFARRFFAKLAPTSQATISDLGISKWTMRDVDPNTRLVVEEQDNAEIVMVTTASFTIQLPEDYTGADRLFAIFESDGILRVAVTLTDMSTSTVLVRGTSDAKGFYSFTEKVSSITISNPSAVSINVRYAVMTYPDLTVAASFRGGASVFGVYTA